MKLTRDEPGRFLVLEGDGIRVPGAVVGCVVVVLLPFALPALWALAVGLRTALGAPTVESLFAIAGGLFWLIVPLVLVAVVRKRAWVPVAFRVDGAAGELVTVERNAVTGRERREVLPLTQIAGATVETATRKAGSRGRSASGWGAALSPTVRVTLRVDDGSRTPRRRRILLPVDGIDRREEVADFAFRFAAACSLPYQRVVRSDPRDIELDLSAAMGIGHERIPALEGPASYASDVVSKAAVAAAAEERVPLFEPTTFPSDHKASKWLPGREVVFHKPFGLASLGCLPFVAAGLLVGPGLFVYSTYVQPASPLSDRLVPSAFLGLFGLVIALVGAAVVASALPRRVTVDWSARTITVGGLFRTTTTSFDDVTLLEMNCVRTYHSGGKNSSSYHSYRCDLQAHLRAGAGDKKPLVLVGTRSFREDPDTPYRSTLPLATELAQSMGVSRRVTDFPV